MSTERPVQKFAGVVSYVGTSFCGWQRQRAGMSDGGKPSIQESIENALRKITQTKLNVVGSGRTDSGVHGLGQVFHFTLPQRDGGKVWEIEKIRRGLNGILITSQIQCLVLKEVPLEFHSQRSAVKKQYSYFFQQGPCALPALEPFSWWIEKPLNVEAMAQALAALRGEHDFLPFRARGAKPGPSVRTIFEAEVTREALERGAFRSPVMSLVRVRVMGSGFLKQMVRGICGTLLQIGENRRPPETMEQILATQDRSLVGPTAPARALFLDQVWYDSIDFMA